MQDLVRVGVADAAQQPRIGERTLEGVALARERTREGGEIDVHRLDAAGVEGGETGVALHDVERGPLLRARLGEGQGAGGEVEGGEPDLSRDPGPWRLPV